MSIERLVFCLIPLLGLSCGAAAQTPISAIEWLDRTAPLATPPPEVESFLPPLPGEPPVAGTAGTPAVAVQTLDGPQDGPVGLLSHRVTGLPIDLWSGMDGARAQRMIGALNVDDLPAMQTLLYSLLLSETLPPKGNGQDIQFLTARIDKLTELGAVNAALALIDHAGSERHADLFRRHFDLSLIAGVESDACARMAARPDLAPGYDARVYCMARLGDWPAAMLTFSSMRALGEFDKRSETLLSLFLEPELVEDTPPLAPPARATPLVFRLQESIGQPLATATLPRAYAFADLRNVSGWKAELEAVERLARSGAVPENRLIGVYGARKAAASGGIWDRVSAIQAFDAAMQSADAQEVSDTLTAAWAAMRDARLEVPFANLYGADLARLDLPGLAARRVAFRVAMLSPAYESAANRMVPVGPEETFLAALARGRSADAIAHSARARAVATAFAGDGARDETTKGMISQQRLGEVILMAMQQYSHAAAGEIKDAAGALATLRAVGLEDTARRAALQLLILDRRN
ncbi:MAG: hypothetical protein ACRBBU_10860 [Pseudooceanicola sp.]